MTWTPSLRSLSSVLALGLGLGALGCGGCGSNGASSARAAAPTSPAAPAAPREVEPAPVEPAPAEPAPSEPVATTPPPPLGLEVRVEGSNVHVAIVNDSDATVSFASRLVLEVAGDDGAWAAVASRGQFVARLDAERALPECAELVAGASLELAFPDLRGESIPEGVAAWEGTHRFVLTSCDGSGRTEGPSFTPPAAR